MMSETKTITIPEYLMVKHHRTFNMLSTLDETDRMIAIISSVVGESVDDVMTWSLPSIMDVYKRIAEVITNNNQTFHPIIEWNGQLYGFKNMSKMQLDEYIDIDNLTKDTDRNLNEILAVLYRPITRNDVNTGKFIYKSTIKALKYEVENVFDYYDVEKYDSDKRKIKAPEFDNFPLDIALGALGFFLGTKAMLLNDTLSSFHKIQMDKVKKKMTKRKFRLLSTTVGFIHSMNLQKVPSYQSPETNVSPT
jgi:hypothetical protein